MKKKVFITGANGFIGSGLIKYLTKKNKTNVYHSYRNNNFNAEHSSSIAIIGDLTKKDTLERVFKINYDIIIHCAGIAHILVGKKITYKQKKKYVLNNIVLTKKLLNAAIDNNVSTFIFLSTVKVYGENSNSIINETSNKNPKDIYSFTKYKVENFLLNNKYSKKINIIILQLPLTFGPGVKANFASVENYVNKKLPNFFLNFSTKRSFLYTHSFFNLIEKIIEDKRNISERFIVCNDDPINFYELISIIAEAKKIKLIQFNLPKIIVRFLTNYFDKFKKINSNFLFDNSKVKYQYNWKPINIKLALKQYYSDENIQNF